MTSCIYAGSERPRALAGRHNDGCEGDCRGCQPCPESHCLSCGRDHAEHVCPGCLADVRETLGEIGRLCDGLRAEVEVQGVDSEAFNLLGPAADPEAIGHMRASVAVGRVPADWLEVADNDLHPLIVCGTWMEAYLEAFDHDEPARITVAGALSYLTRNLEHIGNEDDIPFRDLRRDLSACRAHLERVLHDGEQVETGAPCMTCRVPLRLVRGERDDRWRCPRCKQESTDAQYRFAVQHLHRESSPWLTAAEVEIVANVKPAALRKRVERGEVTSRRDSGRVVYAAEQIPEVMATRQTSA